MLSAMQLTAKVANDSHSLNALASEKSVILDLSTLPAKVELFIITDYTGEDIFREKVGESERRIKYDLSNLPSGRYSIKVEGEDFVEIHTTLITEDQVIFERIDAHLRPTFEVFGEKLSVHTKGSHTENIDLVIYDETGELVYEFQGQTSDNFQKVFNLSMLAKGTYHVVASTNYFSESQSISL